MVADTDRAFLILETGYNDRWRCGAARLGSPLARPAAPAPHIHACCQTLRHAALPLGWATGPRPAQPCLHVPACRYGAYRRTLETTAEAQAWEQAKQAVGCERLPVVPTLRRA